MGESEIRRARTSGIRLEVISGMKSPLRVDGPRDQGGEPGPGSGSSCTGAHIVKSTRERTAGFVGPRFLVLGGSDRVLGIRSL